MIDRPRFRRLRAAFALAVSCTYVAASGFAEVEETDAAVEELVEDGAFRTARRGTMVPGWALALAAGVAGAAVVVPSLVTLRRSGASADGGAPRDVSAAPPDPDPAVWPFEPSSADGFPWAFLAANQADDHVLLRLRYAGVGAAHRVYTLGLPPGSGLARPADAEAGHTILPLEILSVPLAGRPARCAFHLCYRDARGATWWLRVDYRDRVVPPVVLGPAERDADANRAANASA